MLTMERTQKEGKTETRQVAWVCLLLVLAVLAVFGQTVRFGFVNYDDQFYVYENDRVMSGLSLPGVAWAFTHVMCHFYHPLTVISLMVDYQLHKLNAGGYHLTNVLLHAASSVLLFLILRRMTGALWRSAFVAAVFAVHPLRVESVAWVSERKDVLAGFFFMLTIGAYVRYVRNPNSLGGYLMVAVFFGLDLLCKPTGVTLPFVLLLLDYWPLGRMGQKAEIGQESGAGASVCGLVREKVPLMALAAAACVVNYFAEGKMVASIAQISIPMRISGALVSYVVYLRQMVWPAGLAAYYPYPPRRYPFWEIGLAFLALTGISGGAWALWRKRPWFAAGWLWYLGMLVPMIGIVQLVNIAHADRFTYLPQIGLYVLATWAAADLSAGWRRRRMIQGGISTAVLAVLMYCAFVQTSFWRNSKVLWTRTLSCTTANAFAEHNLGLALFNQGDLQEAIAQYQKALEINPDYAEARNNLGYALQQKGDMEGAVAQYQQVLEVNPDYENARFNLGVALFLKGDLEGAIAQYRKALEIRPGDSEAQNNLGMALAREGRVDEAIASYRRAIQINPRFADACDNLGLAHFRKGETKEAFESWQQALEIKPGQISALNSLAWLLATTADAALRDGAKAVSLAERATRLSGGGNVIVLHTLAAAYAEAGRYGEATATARRALELAVAQKNADLPAKLAKEIKLYEANTPVRDVPQ
jgi:tetratricopeptide (TPR) repeat protein